MKYISTSVFLFVFLQNPSYAQNDQSVWKTLAKVSFKSKYVANYKSEYPVFSQEIKNLNGKLIRLKGYMLPLEESNSEYFIFSLYPYNSCYFCGGAGPETVMEVRTKKSIGITERAIILKGFLKLNDSDPNQLMYILENAEQVGI